MVLANCLLSEQFLNGLCSNYWSVPWSTWSCPLKFGQDYSDTSQEPAQSINKLFFFLNHLLLVHGEDAETYPSCTWAKVGYTPG